MMYRTLPPPRPKLEIIISDTTVIVPWSEVEAILGHPYAFTEADDDAVQRTVLNLSNMPPWLRWAWQDWRETGYTFIKATKR